jgi:hypothetical protein
MAGKPEAFPSTDGQSRLLREFDAMLNIRLAGLDPHPKICYVE